MACSSNLSNTVRQAIMRKHISNEQKKLVAIRKQQNYTGMNPTAKRKYLDDKAQKYQLLKPTKKAKLLSNKRENSHTWYESLDPTEKEKLLSSRAHWYKSLNSAGKQNIMSHVQSSKKAQKNTFKSDNLDHKISVFQREIRKGPCYICSVCNRILYRKTVILLKKTKVQHSASVYWHKFIWQ